MSLCVRRWIPVVAVVVASHALSAQEPRRLAQPDSIPLELAGALIANGGFGTEPQILVGMLPGWMNSRVFLPPGGRVLGSAFIGSVTVGVLAVSDQPDIAIAQFKPELAKRGWNAPAPRQSTYSGGGFRAAPPEAVIDAAPVTRLTLCGGDQQMLMVSAVRRSGTTTQIVYRVTPTTSYGVCAPPQQQTVELRYNPTPTLINPVDAGDFRTIGNCTTRGQTWGSAATVRTSLSLAALLDHYGKQMQDSGWHPTSAMIVGRTWTRTDSTGKVLEASIVASESARDSSCRDLGLNVGAVTKR